MKWLSQWLIRLRSKKHRLRMTGVLMALVLIPMVGLTYYAGHIVKQVMLERLRLESENSIAQLCFAVEQVVEQVDSGFQQFAAQDTVKKFIAFPNGLHYARLKIASASVEELQQHYYYVQYKKDLYQALVSLKVFNSFIDSVVLLDPQKELVLSTSGQNLPYSVYEGQGWLEELESRLDLQSFVGTPRRITADDGSVFCGLTIVYTLQKSARLVINLNLSELLSKVTDNFSGSRGIKLIVVDSEYTPLYIGGSLSLPEENQRLLLEKLAGTEQEERSSPIEAGDGRYYCASRPLENLNCSILGVSGMDSFLREIGKVERLAMFALLLLGCYCLLILLLTSQFFYWRVQRLEKYLSDRSTHSRIPRDLKKIYEQADLLFLQRDRLERQLEDSLPIYRQQFFASFLTGGERPTELAKKLSYFNIHLQAAVLLLFQVEGGNEQLTEPGVRTLFDSLFASQREYLLTSIRNEQVAVALEWEAENLFSLCELAETLCRKLEEGAGGICYAGVSRVCSSFEQLRDGYQDAKVALQYRDITGSTRVICIEDIVWQRKAPARAFPYEQRELLAQAVCRGEAQRTVELYDRLITEIAHSSEAYLADDILERLLWIHSGVLEAAVRGGMEPPAEENASAVLRVYSEEGLNSVLLRQRDMLEAMAKRAEREFQFQDNTYMEKIYEAIRSIELCNLSLEQVAGVLGVNPTYLSRVFRQKTGQKFIDYVTALRLERAKELLRTTSMKIQDIALEVGWSKANHLIKLFKEATGVTPNEYRRLK